MKIFFLPNKNKFRNPKVWIVVSLASKYGRIFYAIHQYMANKNQFQSEQSIPSLISAPSYLYPHQNFIKSVELR